MSSSYLFRDLRIVNSGDIVNADIRIAGGRITEVKGNIQPARNENVLDCAGMCAYPGLINAHDHLQFNLYPRIGNPPYGNAYEWGNDIRINFRNVIDPIEAIPIRHRYLWGAWKNLFSGVTFVVHHDPWSFHFDLRFPVPVLRRYTMAHSLGNEKNIARSLRQRRPDTPFIMHVAEGTDRVASAEVAALHSLGGLDHRTVAVHAVAVSQEDIATIERRRASIVWCPSSNMFLFGKTIPDLVGTIAVAVGTDSTLTGSVTLFDEMRRARSLRGCTAKEIMTMVTDVPRRIFNLPQDIGQLREDGVADLFLLPSLRDDPYETLLGATPGDIQLLMQRGRIIFADRQSFPSLTRKHSSRLRIGDATKVFSGNGCEKLVRQLRPFLGHFSYLGGKVS